MASVDVSYFRDLGMGVIGTINNVLVPVLFAVAFIVFIWGIAKAYIFNAGNEGERKKGHQLMLWGLIGFAVMLSVWGLVNIVTDTFGLNKGGLPGGSLPQGPVII